MNLTASPFFEIQQTGMNRVKFSRHERGPFVWAVDYALRSGGKFSVSISRAVADAIPEINKAFKKHNVAVQITADSDPRAVDYFFSALGGATFGAVGGSTAGAAIWATAKAYKAAGAIDVVIPGLGLCLAIPAAVGAVIGAAAGASSTYYGLRIRFVQIDQPSPATQTVAGSENEDGAEALALDLVPAM